MERERGEEREESWNWEMADVDVDIVIGCHREGDVPRWIRARSPHRLISQSRHSL